MNWEAIAAIGQAIGAVGVIVSLLYLAGQVRQARHAVKSASADAVVASSKEFSRLIIENADVARIFLGGQSDPRTLATVDRYRYFQMGIAYLIMIENVHYHYCEGTLAPRLWQGMRLKIVAMLSSPGMREVWRRWRGLYEAGSEFVKFVDSIHAEAPAEDLRQASRGRGESAPARETRREPEPAAHAQAASGEAPLRTP